MLCFIPFECVNWAMDDKDGIIYNLNAIGENVKSLGLPNLDRLLASPIALYNANISYDQYIFGQNNEVFCLFMSVMEKLFNGLNVYLIKSNYSDYDESIEQLQRLIFARYGYRSQIINSIDDIYYIDQSEGSFNIIGIQNYDIDANRYFSLLQSMHQNGVF